MHQQQQQKIKSTDTVYNASEFQMIAYTQRYKSTRLSGIKGIANTHALKPSRPIAGPEPPPRARTPIFLMALTESPEV